MTLHPDGQGPAVLDVSVQPTVGGTVLVLVGELDMATASHFVSQVAQLVVADRVDGDTRVTVDLSSVVSLDVSGLSALLEARGLVHDAGGTFAVTGASSVTLHLLQVTGLAGVLGVLGVLGVQDGRPVARPGGRRLAPG